MAESVVEQFEFEGVSQMNGAVPPVAEERLLALAQRAYQGATVSRSRRSYNQQVCYPAQQPNSLYASSA